MAAAHANANSTMIDTSKIDCNLQQAFQELTIALVKKYDNQIKSIVVFGSATTGEWIRGKSDVDFIIVTDSTTNRKEVENFANKVLTEIDTRHNLKLKQTCSSFKKSQNIALNAISAIESFMTFGKPFFVLSENQIDTVKGRIRDARIEFVTSIFDSIAIFAAKIKETGSTIYGEDLIKELHVTRSATEKAKAMLAPFWLALMSFAIFPIDPKLALGHSVKATLWACEDSLFYLDQKLSSTTNEVKMLRKILSHSNNPSFEHLELAIMLRPSLRAGVRIEKGPIARFLLNTPIFILTLYKLTKGLSS